MTDIAELFILNFTRNIIEIKAPEVKPIEDQLNYNNMQSSILTRSPINKIIQKSSQPLLKAPLMEIKREPIVKIEQPIKKERPAMTYQTQSEISATDKLNSLIRDPYVKEIECVGADNPLMVKKSGMQQKTQINLSIDEIYEVIAEFSQKTRIPVINGRIKAALNDLIITAALSETLGPRFIIQKKASIKMSI